MKPQKKSSHIRKGKGFQAIIRIFKRKVSEAMNQKMTGNFSALFFQLNIKTITHGAVRILL